MKIAPLSASLWLDTENHQDWHWSVHVDSRVYKSGVASQYHVAQIQLRDAMDEARYVYGPKDANES